nr:hypothetical protein B0A51_12437 [Rachicladosporium sp. CCFEE 5018]
MQFFITALIGFAATVSAAVIPAETITKRSGISVTPHDTYGSSIGVLGCKVNTNRIAYWPLSPGCGKCAKVTANGRSLHLLHVDQSGGAYDISYSAWNYFNTGNPAHTDPTMGGGIAADFEYVDMSNCADLLHEKDGKLALSATNSMNTISACLSDSWFANNYAIYNIANPNACTYGMDETCSIEQYGVSLPVCPHQLGIQTALTTDPVVNIQYATGNLITALQ